jgi:uncharacterized phiE125 gp8 family phage protein
MITGEIYHKDGNMEYSVITEPVIEPVTLEELKLFGRIDGEDEDLLLTNFIVSARMAAEQYLRRSLITRTIRARIDYWLQNQLELPMPPLITVSKIATVNEDGTETEFDSDNYYVVNDAIPGKVIIKQGISKPYTYDREKGGIIIEYTAGYGAEPDDIPNPIRTGIMLWAMNIYENRVISNDPPPEALATLNLFRVERVELI